MKQKLKNEGKSRPQTARLEEFDASGPCRVIQLDGSSPETLGGNVKLASEEQQLQVTPSPSSKSFESVVLHTQATPRACAHWAGVKRALPRYAFRSLSRDRRRVFGSQDSPRMRLRIKRGFLAQFMPRHAHPAD